MTKKKAARKKTVARKRKPATTIPRVSRAEGLRLARQYGIPFHKGYAMAAVVLVMAQLGRKMTKVRKAKNGIVTVRYGMLSLPVMVAWEGRDGHEG